MNHKRAHQLISDLMCPIPLIYWTDMTLSATLTYLCLFGALGASSVSQTVLFLFLGAWPLYRAFAFIHELTHFQERTLPGFRWAWNLLVGIPFLVPSFMYIGVHGDHHNPRRFGTEEDPEYYPLGHSTLAGTVVFLLLPLAAPLGLFVRFLILAPVGRLLPEVGEHVFERYSALAINPTYRRKRFTKQSDQREYLLQESLATLWATLFAALLITRTVPPRALVCWAGIAMIGHFINQLRTLAAHRWEHEGESELSFEAQLLDSINHDSGGILTELWAPVGLRYHALHHWFPGLPYHSLPQAHRRLMESLPSDSIYHQTNSSGFLETFRRLRQFQRTSDPTGTPSRAE